MIKRIIKEKQLDEYLIRELSTHYTRENEEIIVEIDYYKFSPEELKTKPIEEQIHTVLLKMGYSESDIRRIEYRKFWSNSDKKVWVATVHEEKYHEALDEPDSYAVKAIENSLMETAKKVLGFKLYFYLY